MSRVALVSLLSCAVLTLSAARASDTDDPNLWLEEVQGARALDWVEAENAVSLRELEGDPGYAPLKARLLSILDSRARIPMVSKVGDHLYNFWRDADHVRGIMRRATLDEYRSAEPRWETVLDVDALAAREGENWVWKGWSCRYPDHRRCIVYLSRGGGDARVAREFDLERRAFVAPDAGGFALAEAKGSLTWIDDDHVVVGTDFGPGSLTDSGYPRVLKRWTRGTPLAAATILFEGDRTDVSVDATRFHRKTIDAAGRPIVEYRTLVRQGITFFTNRTFVIDADGRLFRLDLPDDAEAELWQDQLLVTLRGAWPAGTRGSAAGHPAGALLAIGFDRFVSGARDFTVLFDPGPRRSIGSVAGTRSALVVNALSDLRNEGAEWWLRNGAWIGRPVAFPRDGTVGLAALDPDESDAYFVTSSASLAPTTLALAEVGSDRREALKALPSLFDATGMRVVLDETRSADGTRVPYAIVYPRGFEANGQTPTILYGYGGFEVALLPRAYGAISGAAWLERGGVFVVAGLRGGGEFGAEWHRAALKENRQRSYDDFIAVARDLVERRITSPAHLGIMGGSNGGLLVGAVAVQRPDLFGAVVCQVPLLDMRRYHKLLAGASWMGEYGNPDVPAEWDWISKYSPYQNLKAGVRYPRIFLDTSTRDDRVHPGHARKMAAKLKAQGHDYLYFENTEGGHAGAANNLQQATMQALEYTFMWRALAPRP